MNILRKVSFLGLILLNLHAFGQLEVRSSDHHEKLYSHWNNSLQLDEVTTSGELSYVFYFHDQHNPSTEKRTEFWLSNYQELRQFLDLAAKTVRTKEEFETDKYTIKHFHDNEIDQAWVYLPTGEYFHITEAIYIALDKALEER